MKNKIDIKVFFGVSIIAAGILLFLDNLGIGPRVDIFDFWPLILIAIGLNQLIQPPKAQQPISGAIFLFLGAYFLLDNFIYIPFDLGDLWPVFLILVGFSMLKNHVWSTPENGDEGDFINLSFILGGGDHKFTSQTLAGGKITAIMGGGKIDLRQAGCTGDTLIIDTFAFWGGIEIIVPFHWQVNIQGSPIMGAMENLTSSPMGIEGIEVNLPPKTLIVKGSAIMGGVEVKN
jgi:predicted membrane protein